MNDPRLLTLIRGEVEIIDVPSKLVKPRRFDMTLLLNGVTWRRIQIETSPDEGAVRRRIRCPRARRPIATLAAW